MHPHLNRINDGDKCAEVTRLLEECHARGFMWKAIGMCNGAKHNLNKCLRAERLERTKKNREAAKEKRKEIAEKWAEIEANS
ncbi:UPF0287-domain-containing protein [Choiromyces venosus 120613-1]|uniref:COX assembly mitochondrial protein n=1 Tax=Choiromyces venosus 120613-1 TaxID=1336337 RepID=A0A3N4JXM7_9PEZI|nr:UPF0287-domain-containing protein [Choiromyces venosus 120613-1]